MVCVIFQRTVVISMPSLTPSDPKLWIKASVAAKRLGDKLQNPLAAKDTLADYLRDGRLKSQAKSVSSSEGESIDLAWKRHPELDEIDEYWTIEAKDWQVSKRWAGDRAYPCARDHAESWLRVFAENR